MCPGNSSAKQFLYEPGKTPHIQPNIPLLRTTYVLCNPLVRTFDHRSYGHRTCYLRGRAVALLGSLQWLHHWLPRQEHVRNPQPSLVLLFWFYTPSMLVRLVNVSLSRFSNPCKLRSIRVSFQRARLREAVCACLRSWMIHPLSLWTQLGRLGMIAHRPRGGMTESQDGRGRRRATIRPLHLRSKQFVQGSIGWCELVRVLVAWTISGSNQPSTTPSPPGKEEACS